MNQLIVITGPTASGKTQLAIKKAKELGCDIINADSRQVYSEMNIGTAKPTQEDLDLVRHHFIGSVSIHEDYNVGIYENEVITFLTNYFKTNDVAVMVGGTGLYIDAVIHGIDLFPDIPQEVKDLVAKLYQENGIEALQVEVQKLDPAYFNEVDKLNPRRLSRALEVIYTTSGTFSMYRSKIIKKRDFAVTGHLIEMERSKLYAIIEKRVDSMIEAGLEDEALTLFPFKHLKALQTVGYQEWFDYFNGHTDKQTAVDRIKQNTRRYAKRQITWMKKYKDWKM